MMAKRSCERCAELEAQVERLAAKLTALCDEAEARGAWVGVAPKSIRGLLADTNEVPK